MAFVDDSFRGHFIFEDHVEPLDPMFFKQRVRQLVVRFMEDDVWKAMYIDGQLNNNRRRMDIQYKAWAREEVYHDMGRLS